MNCKHVSRGPEQSIRFDGTSMGRYCADTTVVCIFVLIAEELGYAFTRGRNMIALIAEELVHAFTRERSGIALSADRAAKARPAAAKAAARAAGA